MEFIVSALVVLILGGFVYLIFNTAGYFGGYIEQHPKGSSFKTYVWLDGNIVHSFSDPLDRITPEQIKWRRQEAKLELKRWKEIYKKGNL